MKLKPDSKHALPEPTGLHRIAKTERTLSRAQRGTLSAGDAVAMVSGNSSVTAQSLSKAVVKRARKELK